MKRHNDTSGFTLIEMMIVVAIVAILAAIAIPNMLRARSEANEASAIGDLRVIGGAQVTYNTSRYTYGDFDALTGAVGAPGTELLPDGWHEGRQKSGYVFSMPTVSSSNFVCFADPVEQGLSGTRYFRMDASGIVRYDPLARPEADSPQVGST